MNKLFITLLIFISFSTLSQVRPLSMGIGIGNQYGLLSGLRVAYFVNNKIEPSISFGQGFGAKNVVETTLGLSYYFKGSQIGINKKGKYNLPGGLSYGLNWYHVFNNTNKNWDTNMIGHTLLLVYHLTKGENTFHRIGFGATYIQGHPTEIGIIPSFVYGFNYRLPFKVKN
jgi:hypothetical protein